MTETEYKIDLVYLWVDGNDKKWQEDKRYWEQNLGLNSVSSNICRFIDNQELKYSIRSVMQNIPWINKIFIVTNGQVPSWLDINNSRIKIVKHEDIMPKDALPCFNSEAIEMCIANIEELSEYFLYANDDFFIAQEVGKSYFFNNKGMPIVRLSSQEWKEEEIEDFLYQANVTHIINLIKKQYGKEYKYESIHNIDAYRKSYIKDCLNEFKEEANKTIYSKFRTKKSLQRIIYALHMLVNNKAELKECDFIYKNKPLENLYIPLRSKQNMENLYNKNNPILFCINDDEKTQDNERCYLENFLISKFPQATEFEKKEEFQIEPIWDDAKTIVFAPDNRYCKYFSVALQSLLNNSQKESNYDIIIFHNEIEQKNQVMLKSMLPSNFSIRFIDIDKHIYKIFGELKLQSKNYWSISMYYRIFIPFIMQKYSKVLYCDSDICFNNSIDKLFDINFDDKSLLAIIDDASTILYKNKKRKKYMEDVLGLKSPENYFNSGVLMFKVR